MYTYIASFLDLPTTASHPTLLGHHSTELSSPVLYRSFTPATYLTYGSVCACTCAQSLQSHLTLCDPVDCSPPGYSIHGILQEGYWRGFPCPPPGDLSDPGVEPTSSAS